MKFKFVGGDKRVSGFRMNEDVLSYVLIYMSRDVIFCFVCEYSKMRRVAWNHGCGEM